MQDGSDRICSYSITGTMDPPYGYDASEKTKRCRIRMYPTLMSSTRPTLWIGVAVCDIADNVFLKMPEASAQETRAANAW